MGSYSGNYRQRPGMMSSPQRPEALPPVPEEYAGTNFPYRGAVNHGVTPTEGVDPEAYYDNDQYDGTPTIEPSIPADKEPDPIPVKLVNETARERYAFRTYTFPANPDTAQQVCGRNDKRHSVKIKNHSTAAGDLIVGPQNSGLDQVTGYVLEPGQELNLRTTEEIYILAIVAPGSYITAAVCEELSVEI